MTTENILCRKNGREKYFSQEQLDLLGTQDGKHDGWEKAENGVVKSTGIFKTLPKEDDLSLNEQNDALEGDGGVQIIAENLEIDKTTIEGVQKTTDKEVVVGEVEAIVKNNELSVNGKKLAKEPKEPKDKSVNDKKSDEEIK